MGAILPPMQTEPARLFGTQGTCVVLRVILLSRPLSSHLTASLSAHAAAATGAATAIARRSRRRADAGLDGVDATMKGTPRTHIITHVPQHGIRRRLARTPGADDVADVGQRKALLF